MQGQVATVLFLIPSVTQHLYLHNVNMKSPHWRRITETFSGSRRKNFLCSPVPISSPNRDNAGRPTQPVQNPDRKFTNSPIPTRTEAGTPSSRRLRILLTFSPFPATLGCSTDCRTAGPFRSAFSCSPAQSGKNEHLARPVTHLFSVGNCAKSFTTLAESVT